MQSSFSFFTGLEIVTIVAIPVVVFDDVVVVVVALVVVGVVLVVDFVVVDVGSDVAIDKNREPVKANDFKTMT